MIGFEERFAGDRAARVCPPHARRCALVRTTASVWFVGLVLAAFACTPNEPSRETEPAPKNGASTRIARKELPLVSTTSLDASGDTYLKSGAPNQNVGGDTRLSLQSSGKHRTLLFFSSSALAAAVGNGTMLSARIDLTVASNSNNWGTSGRLIAIHQLKQASAEYQATWNCALDSNVNNQQSDCSTGASWSMNASDPALQPWISPASATALISNGQMGVVSFDVTSDVAAILSGSSAGHGWVLKKVEEGQNGSVEFASRELGSAPQLVLQIEGGTGGGPVGPVTGSTTLAANADTHIRHGQPNQNFGADGVLRIQAAGRNRALVGFDAAAATSALAGPLVRARLMLPIAQTFDNWGPSRAIGAHRLRRAWSEPAATWNCAIDGDVTNAAADCSGDAAWVMLGAADVAPWVNPPTDTVLVTSGQAGTLELDVTRDLACHLAGHTSFHGWLIKKEAESQNGKIELASRETATHPSLLLEWTDVGGTGVLVTPQDCAVTGPPGGCTPTSSLDATCDNVDDDCDGTADDDFSVEATSCGIGACSSTGATSCVMGVIVNSCAPGTPATGDASCNGIDEDCDGAMDEDYVASATSCGIGACASTGLTSCVSGEIVNSCAPGVPANNDATCNGNDDDCDESIDEDFVPGCAGASRQFCVGGVLQTVDCSDGNACNGTEGCEGGICQSGVNPAIDDGDFCTADSCEPSSGVLHEPIEGCDGAPTAGGGRFETRASVLGKVLSSQGAPVTDFTLVVHDAPVDGEPRDDIQITTADDGSFRARLADFPESFSESTPSAHVIVRIETDRFIPVLRDVYVRPGDAVDLGRIHLLERDPAVTVIGPAGGVASDSQGRIEVTFPPGAVGSPIPVRITPIPERRLFPYPLPDSTDSGYGMVFEPSQEFAAPVTVRLDNYLNIPTSLQIPVGFVDEERARWEHATLAVWDGSFFRFELEHFSIVDSNPGKAGQLFLVQNGGPDPRKSGDGNCAGSSVSYGSGALRQSFELPAYVRQGRKYSLTLNYDSSLTGALRLGQGPVSSSAVVKGEFAPELEQGGSPPAWALTMPLPGPKFSFECRTRGGSGGGGCATGAGCGGGFAMPVDISFRTSMFGSDIEGEELLAPGRNALSTPSYAELPLNEDGTVPRSDYFPFTRTLRVGSTLSGGGTCSGGGGAFGVDASVQPPVASTLQPGAMMREHGYELMYHRRSSPFGTGWGIDEIHEAFRAPNGAQIDLIHGDGQRESFYPRIEPDVVATVPIDAVLGRDAGSGELFSFSNGISRINTNWSLTPVGPSVSLQNPRNMAVTTLGGVRHFIVATSTGLFDLSENGQQVQLASWAQQSSSFNRPHVAADGDAVYFTDGIAHVIRRVLLGTAQPVVESISQEANGDIRLDPGVPASQVSFDAPRGLAVGPDGSLYVACFRRHIVYRLLPDPEDGRVGPDSLVKRVLGDGMGSFSTPRSGQQVAVQFSMHQPLDLAMSEDGYLFVMNIEGLVRFDPINQMARWFVSSKDQGLTFDLHDNPSFLALDAGRALVNNARLITLTEVDMTSEFDPTRRVFETATGLQLIDTTADIIESYDWADSARVRARFVSRAARTGELLLSAGYVPNSDRIAWLEDPTGGRFSFEYDSSGSLSFIEDAASRVSSVTIDGSNNLRELQLPTGETRRFDYDGHLMVAAFDPRGEQTSYTFRSNGSVERVTRPEGGTREFEPAFDEPTYIGNELVQQGRFTDDRGVVHDVQVNEAGEVIRDQYVADGVPYDMRRVYSGTLPGDFRENRENKILRVSHTTLNGLQVTPTISWDVLGRPTLVSNPSTGTGIISSGTRYELAYNAAGRLSLLSPAEANIRYQYQFDPNGRVSRIQDLVASVGTPTARRTDFTWRSDGQIDVLTAHNTPTSHFYDPASGNLIARSDVTQSLSFGHDLAGNVTLQDDGATQVSRTYDDSNRLLTSTDAAGNTTVFGYGHQGCGCARDDLITSIIPPDLAPGLSWRMEYDGDGHLTRLVDPHGFSEQYLRTPQGDIGTFVNALSRSTVFSYDQLGRLATRQDPAGRMGIYAYSVPTSAAWNGPTLYAGSPDGVAAPTSLTAPLAAGQYQVGLNAFPVGDGPAQIDLYRDATFALSYGNRVDNLLRREKRRDRSDLSFSSTSPFGSPSTSHGPFMDASYGYLSNSSLPLVDVYESDYPAESFFEAGDLSYNTFFDLTNMAGWGSTQHLSVVGVEHTLSRDPAGRVTAMTERFNARNVTGSATVSYQAPSWSYTYDANGYLDTINNGSGIQAVTYDARGLVETRSLAFQIATPASTITEGTFRYEYDEVGRNTRLQYPDEHVRTQEYDALGRLISRCYDYGEDGVRCYTAQYDATGNPTVLTDPEGTSTITYDNLDRVTQVLRQTPGEPDEIETYSYNLLGALSLNAGTLVDHQRPRLDGAGSAPAGIPATLDGSPVTLDPGGRVTALRDASLVYTKQTKLREVQDGATLHRNGYDALQRRIGYQKTGLAADAYQYEADNIVTILNAAGLAGIQKRILYDGIDHPLWMYDNVRDITLYFELDIIGNVRRLRGGHAVAPNSTPPAVDLGGYRYTAFGRLYPENDATPYPTFNGTPYEQPFRWQGRPFIDAAGGLYDFRARTWSPELGAFLELDGFEYLTPSGTLWSWPGQNPFRWADPTGREPCARDPNATLEAMAEQFILKHGEELQNGFLMTSLIAATIASGGMTLEALGLGTLEGAGAAGLAWLEGLGTQGALTLGGTAGALRIVDQVDDVVEIAGKAGDHNIRILANMAREGGTLFLRRAHIEGPGAGQIGVRALFDAAREFGRSQGVQRIVIEGARRTTGAGAQSGAVPRPIEIRIP